MKFICNLAMIKCRMNSTKLLSILLTLIPLASHAARPLVTDDARLTKSGSCQVESWLKTYSSGDEFWALPACNPSGNFEVTLGVAVAKQKNEPSTDDYIFQAKTLFKELKTNSWAIGMAVGTAEHQDTRYPGPNGIGSTYLYFPLSHSFFDDKLITHINLGYIRYKHLSQDGVTWGLGGEYKVRDNLLYVLETFGDKRQSSYIQTGLRYSIVPDVLQVDTTLGRQYNTDDSNWLSIGVRYTPDKFF